MDDAVIAFFVLSGFVIAYVVSRSHEGVRSYVLARVVRLYSVVVPAILLTYGLDELGKYFEPEFYTRQWGYQGNEAPFPFVTSLLFLNQIWYRQIAVGLMLPFWSLAYEAWYYVLFGILYFGKSKWRVVLLVLTFLLAGPKILAFFPIWMCGYFAFRYVIKTEVNGSLGAGCLLFSFIGYAAYIIWLRVLIEQHDDIATLLGLDNFLKRYCVAFLFTLHLVGICWASRYIKGCFRKAEKIIRWFAGATFTIYLLHIPVAQFLTTVSPWRASDWRNRAFILFGTVALLFLVASFTERKKNVWKLWVGNLYGQLRRLSSVMANPIRGK
jgi:peptidoglycan/LPS O-acetylase OafA/YrhL